MRRPQLILTDGIPENVSVVVGGTVFCDDVSVEVIRDVYIDTTLVTSAKTDLMFMGECGGTLKIEAKGPANLMLHRSYFNKIEVIGFKKLTMVGGHVNELTVSPNMELRYIYTHQHTLSRQDGTVIHNTNGHLIKGLLFTLGPDYEVVIGTY